jgi:hypothetical protein
LSSINQENVQAIQRSLQIVGPLHEIIKDQNGRTLSGRHRELADQGWPTRTIEVKDGLERELIILLSNVQRKPTEEELKFRLNRIAMEYWLKHQCAEEKVCAAICDLLSPEQGPKVYSSRRWLEHILEPRWKAKTIPKTIPKKVEVTSTSDIPEKLETIKKTALALQGQSVTGEIQYPHEDCKCHECLGHMCCYGCQPTKL